MTAKELADRARAALATSAPTDVPTGNHLEAIAFALLAIQAELAELNQTVYALQLTLVTQAYDAQPADD